METTEQKIEQLLTKFSALSSWEERYKKIIEMGKDLPVLEDQFKTEALLVKGCQSQVWLKAELQEDQTVLFKGESDSVIVQGLLALLLSVYSGQKTEDILSTSPDFLEDLGLKKHLTPNRANGVYAMVKQIIYYAQAFQLLTKRV